MEHCLHVYHFLEVNQKIIKKLSDLSAQKLLILYVNV